ncbi:toxic anion resistance protein [Candidatus Electronema sp. JC]|uniref:toxic anion resistance protein n=1 Tax=Candidatus Electronema sp. JC TaxID=3401570 RepID=UPI003B435021
MLEAREENALVKVDERQLSAELGLVDPARLEVATVDPELEKMAAEFADRILHCNPEDAGQLEVRQQHVAAIDNLGSKAQKDSALRSAMLREPIRKLAQKGEDGGEVANALVNLNLKVDELDPEKFNLNPGWFARLLGMIPGVGTPLKRYFLQFESAQTVLDAIFRSLQTGADTLKRDNITLTDDQKQLRLATHKLRKAIELGMMVDKKLSLVAEQEIPSDDPRNGFIKEELLFPLRQRLMDLQQQLAVNQQAVLAIEIIIRNNKELIRGVSRAVNVTVNALNVAVTVALALANQRIVLKKIEAVNETTNKLIGDTARRLKDQGTAIHKQASTSQLDIQVLKQAFADIHAALDDIARFRQEALPQMAKTVLEMDRLTNETDDAIKKMERGNQASPAMYLDID